ncbi:unnamed protein product [Symbiodinium sp. CCMP2592]|nr:unnamed protein product [Symbiodinium sp. CCMP2592]
MDLVPVIIDLTHVGGQYFAYHMPRHWDAATLLAKFQTELDVDPDQVNVLVGPTYRHCPATELLSLCAGQAVLVLRATIQPPPPFTGYGCIGQLETRGALSDLPVSRNHSNTAVWFRQQMHVLNPNLFPGQDVTAVLATRYRTSESCLHVTSTQYMPDLSVLGSPCAAICVVEETATEGLSHPGADPTDPRQAAVLCDLRPMGLPPQVVHVEAHDAAFTQVWQALALPSLPGWQIRIGDRPDSCNQHSVGMPYLSIQAVASRDPTPIIVPGASVNGLHYGSNELALQRSSRQTAIQRFRPHRRPHTQVAPASDSDTSDNGSQHNMIEGQVLVLTLGYIGKVFDIELRAPATVSECIEAVRREVPSGLYVYFPNLVEVKPQLSDQWATVLALPCWTAEASIVVLDLSQIDGRIFAAEFPAEGTHASLCALARLPAGSAFDIYAYGATIPLLEEGILPAVPHGSIQFVPGGEAPMHTPSLASMLSSADGWDPEAHIPRGPGGHRGPFLCAVLEDGNRLYQIKPSKGQHYTDDLAAEFGIAPHWTTAQITYPRVHDAGFLGYRCRGIALISALFPNVPVPPARATPGNFLIALDCRALFQGWHQYLVQDYICSRSDISRRFQVFAPAGFQVQIDGVGLSDDGDNIVVTKGQILTVHWVPQEAEPGSDYDCHSAGPSSQSVGDLSPASSAEARPLYGQPSPSARDRSRSPSRPGFSSRSLACHRSYKGQYTASPLKLAWPPWLRPLGPDKFLTRLPACSESDYCAYAQNLVELTIPQVQHKLLQEPHSSRPSLRWALAAVRAIAQDMGQPWRYIPHEDAAFLDLNGSPETSEADTDDVRWVSCLVVTPDYKSEAHTIAVRFPSSVADITIALAIARQPRMNQWFPSLIPAHPQTLVNTGVWLACPAFQPTANLVCLDTSAIDGRVFAREAPQYADISQLLELAQVPETIRPTVWTGWPLAQLDATAQVHILSGATFVFMAYGEEPEEAHALDALLDWPDWWHESGSAHTPTLGSTYGVVHGSRNLPFVADMRVPATYRRQLAQCIDVAAGVAFLFLVNAFRFAGFSSNSRPGQVFVLAPTSDPIAHPSSAADSSSTSLPHNPPSSVSDDAGSADVLDSLAVPPGHPVQVGDHSSEPDVTSLAGDFRLGRFLIFAVDFAPEALEVPVLAAFRDIDASTRAPRLLPVSHQHRHDVGFLLALPLWDTSRIVVLFHDLVNGGRLYAEAVPPLPSRTDLLACSGYEGDEPHLVFIRDSVWPLASAHTVTLRHGDLVTVTTVEQGPGRVQTLADILAHTMVGDPSLSHFVLPGQHDDVLLLLSGNHPMDFPIDRARTAALRHDIGQALQACPARSHESDDTSFSCLGALMGDRPGPFVMGAPPQQGITAPKAPFPLTRPDTLLALEQGLNQCQDVHCLDTTLSLQPHAMSRRGTQRSPEPVAPACPGTSSVDRVAMWPAHCKPPVRPTGPALDTPVLSTDGALSLNALLPTPTEDSQATPDWLDSDLSFLIADVQVPSAKRSQFANIQSWHLMPDHTLLQALVVYTDGSAPGAKPEHGTLTCGSWAFSVWAQIPQGHCLVGHAMALTQAWLWLAGRHSPNVPTLFSLESVTATEVGEPLVQAISFLSYNVLTLMETRISSTEVLPDADYWMIHSAASADGHHGVALWISRNVPYAVCGIKKWFFAKDHCTVTGYSPRHLIVQLNAPHLCWTVLVCHGPSEPPAASGTAAAFWNMCRRDLAKKPKHSELIVLADANAHLGSNCSASVGSVAPEIETASGTAFHEFLAEHELFLPATFPSVHAGPSHTWVTVSGTSHRLDYIAVPQQWPLDSVSSTVHYQFESLQLSVDHYPVQLTCSLTGRSPDADFSTFRRKAVRPVASRPNTGYLCALATFTHSADMQWDAQVDDHFAALSSAWAYIQQDTLALVHQRQQIATLTQQLDRAGADIRRLIKRDRVEYLHSLVKRAFPAASAQRRQTFQPVPAIQDANGELADGEPIDAQDYPARFAQQRELLQLSPAASARVLAHAALQCSKFRAILLSSVPGKLYHRHIRSCLCNHLPAEDLQAGAVPGIGTEAIALAARVFQATAQARRRSWGLVFYDVKAAFYRVIRQLVAPASDDDRHIRKFFHVLGVPPVALHELADHLSRLAAIPRAGASPHLTAIASDIMQGTWFRIDSSAVLTLTHVGTRPGDSLADVFFAFAFAAYLRASDVALTERGLATATPALCSTPPWGKEPVPSSLGAGAWADDFVHFHEQADNAGLVPQLVRIVTVYVERADTIGMQLTFAREKTAAMLQLEEVPEPDRSLIQHGPGGPFLMGHSAAYVALWRVLLRRQPHEKTPHAYTVLLRAAAPSPPLALALARAALLRQIVGHGPPTLRQLLWKQWEVEADSSWLGQIVKDIRHVAQYNPVAEVLLSTGRPLHVLLEKLQEQPTWWTKVLKGAAAKWHQDLEHWEQARSAETAASGEAADQIDAPPPALPFSCHLCQAAFPLRKHLWVHYARKHNVITPTRALAHSDTCVACLRHYSNVVDRQTDVAATQNRLQDAKMAATAASRETLPRGSLRNMEAAIAESKEIDPSYHGHIRDDAKSCWISFPGKYAAGWEALVKEFHLDSVACVFLCSPADGLGKHADDPQNPGKCYCARIYGERDFRAFGYLSVLNAPYTDDRIKKHWEKAAAMNAVPIRQDATDEEKEEATKRAEEQWEKMGRTASWGCTWYKRWFDLVCTAVEKKQRLKAVFFPGQVGSGIPSMEDLSDCEVDLWDGVGCGGSQKSELATAKLMQKQSPGWDYEEVDVTAFLKNEFPPGAQVDALHETEADSRWRKGIVVKQTEKVTATESGDESTEFVWQIKCDDDAGEIFQAAQVRHLNVAVEQLLQRWGDILEPALRRCLADVELRPPTACRLRSGSPALSIGIQIPNVEVLLALRDRVLSGDFDRSVNEGLARAAPEFKVKFDKSRLFELYEDSLLGLKELTDHQQVKLKEMEGLGDVHLSAPAGAGKTFVAVQHVLEHLNTHPSARLLYVAPSGNLGLHFIRWLSMRLASRKPHSEPGLVQSRIQQVLSRITLLHSPFKQFQRPSLDGDRILRRVAEPDAEKCDMVVYDESHHIFSLPPEELGSTLLPSLSAERRLLLSDESQSSSVSQTYPDMARVRLSEVVRSTKRIVTGAATFQLNAQREDAVRSLGSAGPPLKTFLFDPVGEDLPKAYAEHIIKALWHVAKTFPEISLHGRVALLVPDSDSCKNIKQVLQKHLSREFPHRSLRLVTFEDSLCCLPERLLGRSKQAKQENIVLDTVDNADGLEQLVVVCVGLDAPIQRQMGDLQTRSRLYRGLTRAQLLAIVVNERVPEGWLEFLGMVTFSESSDEASAEKESVQNIQKAAARVHEEALEICRGRAETRGAPAGTGAVAGASQTSGDDTDFVKSAQPDDGAQWPMHETSTVWDTSGNTMSKPTSLLFNPFLSTDEARDTEGRTPASVAARFGPLETLKAMKEEDIPDGTSARMAVFSMRFNDAETVMKFRRVHRLLKERNYPVLLPEAAAMTLPHLNRLVQSKGVLLAVCSDDYGEMEAPEKPSKPIGGMTVNEFLHASTNRVNRSSHEELQFAWSRDIEIFPLRLRDDWPPRATFGPDHPYDKDGMADALLAATIPSSKIYVECRGESENWIAAQIARKLRGP